MKELMFTVIMQFEAIDPNWEAMKCLRLVVRSWQTEPFTDEDIDFWKNRLSFRLLQLSWLQEQELNYSELNDCFPDPRPWVEEQLTASVLQILQRSEVLEAFPAV